jgi:hypothetical protein
MVHRELGAAAERPVVDAGGAQHVERDAATIERARQQRQVRTRRVAAHDAARRRVGALLRIDPDAMDDRERLPVAAQRHGGGAARREDHDALRPVAERGEAVLRIAAADGDEHGDAVLDEPRDAGTQPHLGARPALETVAESAREQDRGDASPDRGFDQCVPRLQRGIAQRRRDRRRRAADPGERRIEAEVSDVEKRVARHHTRHN